MLKKKGITVDDYERMFADQHGVCAICEQPELTRRLSVDHNHESGAVRGLLCHRCNVAIGLFKENVEVMVNAIGYLTAQIS